MSNVSNLKTDQYSTRIQASQKQQVEEKQLPIRNDSANFPPALFAKSSIRVIISSRKLPLFKLPFFRLFQVSEGPDFHKTSAKHKKGASLSLLLDRIQFRLLFLLESILTQSADGALEVLGQILKGGAGLNAIVGIAKGRVVFVTAGANVFHGTVSF
jgi:hypothetical protein